MRLTEVYRHFIQVEYNDGVEDVIKSYEYYSTEFMSNTEFQDMLVQMRMCIDFRDFMVIQYLAERRVL